MIGPLTVGVVGMQEEDDEEEEGEEGEAEEDDDEDEAEEEEDDEEDEDDEEEEAGEEGEHADLMQMVERLAQSASRSPGGSRGHGDDDEEAGRALQNMPDSAFGTSAAQGLTLDAMLDSLKVGGGSAGPWSVRQTDRQTGPSFAGASCQSALSSPFDRCRWRLSAGLSWFH